MYLIIASGARFLFNCLSNAVTTFGRYCAFDVLALYVIQAILKDNGIILTHVIFFVLLV